MQIYCWMPNNRWSNFVQLKPIKSAQPSDRWQSSILHGQPQTALCLPWKDVVTTKVPLTSLPESKQVLYQREEDKAVA